LVERTLLRLLLGTKQCVLLNQQLQQQHQQRYANKSKASDEHFLAVLASTDKRSTAPTARPSRRRDVLPPARWRPNEVVSLIESRGPVGRSGANAASGAPRSRRRPLAHLVADELQELAVGDVIVPPGVLPVQPQCEHRKSGIARSRAGTGQACWFLCHASCSTNSVRYRARPDSNFALENWVPTTDLLGFPTRTGLVLETSWRGNFPRKTRQYLEYRGTKLIFVCPNKDTGKRSTPRKWRRHAFLETNEPEILCPHGGTHQILQECLALGLC